MRDFPYPEDTFQLDIAADAYERNPGELPSKEKNRPAAGAAIDFRGSSFSFTDASSRPLHKERCLFQEMSFRVRPITSAFLWNVEMHDVT